MTCETPKTRAKVAWSTIEVWKGELVALRRDPTVRKFMGSGPSGRLPVLYAGRIRDPFSET